MSQISKRERQIHLLAKNIKKLKIVRNLQSPPDAAVEIYLDIGRQART